MRFAVLGLLFLLVAGAVALSILSGGPDPEQPRTDAPTPERPTETTPEEEAATPKEAKPAVTVLSGVVEWAGGGRVADAKVYAHRLGKDLWKIRYDPIASWTGTDELGRFNLGEVEPGWYMVEGRSGDARGYVPVVEVVEGKRRTVVLRLTEPAEIEGWVVDEDGSPVTGAIVSTDLGGALRAYYRAARLPDAAPYEPVLVKTDGNGAFRIHPLPAGQYDLEVKSDGYSSLEVPAVNAPVDGIRLTVWRGYDIPVRIRTKRGVPSRTVRVYTVPAAASIEVVPGDLHKPFVLKAVPEGSWEIRADARSFAADPEHVDIAPGRAVKQVELFLQPGHPVKCHVSARWQDIAGAEVSFGRLDGPAVATGAAPLRATGEPNQVIRRKTNEDGEATVRLPAGYWTVSAFKSGYVRQRRPPVIRMPREWDARWRKVELTLEPDYEIHGTVRFEDGWPVDSARVRVIRVEPVDEAISRRPTANLEPEVATDQGGYRIRKLNPRSRYTLEARAGPKVVARAEPVEFGKGGKGMTRARCDFVLARPEGTVVRGRIVDEESEPVPGATVFLLDGSVACDVDGRFEIAGVRPGVQTARFLAPGWSVGFSEPFLVLDDEVTELPDLMLRRRPIVIAGRIADADGRSVPGARVVVRFGEEGREFSGLTDRNGKYLVRGPGGAKDHVTIRVEANGFLARAWTTAIRPFVDATDVVLSRTATVRGKVGLYGGRAAGVDVVLESPSGKDRLRFAAGSGKNRIAFEARGIPPGSYHLRIEAYPYAPLNVGAVKLEAGAEHRVEPFSTEWGSTLLGRITDSSGDPIKGIVVGLEGRPATARTDEKGYYQLRPVPPGTYFLTLERSGKKLPTEAKVKSTLGAFIEMNLVVPD